MQVETVSINVMVGPRHLPLIEASIFRDIHESHGGADMTRRGASVGNVKGRSALGRQQSTSFTDLKWLHRNPFWARIVTANYFVNRPALWDRAAGHTLME